MNIRTQTKLAREKKIDTKMLQKWILEGKRKRKTSCKLSLAADFLFIFSS